jgi:ADP-heptose:LPS heptosyltransferase
MPDIRWYSLQVDDEAQQETPAGVCRDHVTFMTDFAETAACIANLDLVVTIDTAVAHLTGALGIPGIVMLQPVPDWRWGLDQQTSQWYPSLRLVRQKNPGVWHDVVKVVAELLEQPYPDQQRQ